MPETRLGLPTLVLIAVLGLPSIAAGQNPGDPATQVQIRVRPIPTAPGTASVPPPEELAEVEISEPILELIDRLNDPEFSAREQAMTQLTEGAIDRLELYAALEMLDLAVEQRYRLMVVVQERLILMPRGALGISMNWYQPDLTRPGEVVVSSLLEELPARDVLRLNDHICSVDGQTFRRQDDLVVAVQMKAPGEVVRLHLRRPRLDAEGDPVRGPAGEIVFDTLDVDLTLGSADMLEQQRMSPVERRRRDEADEVASRYRPRVRRLTRGG